MRGFFGNIQPTSEHLKRLIMFLLIQGTLTQNSTTQPTASHHFGSCRETCSAVLIFLSVAGIGIMSHQLCCQIRLRRQALRETDYLMNP